MTKFLLITCFLSALIIIPASCDKEEVSDGDLIRGEWIWVKSYGGIGGWTSTPETAGNTKRLIIDRTTYTEYTDDTISFQSPYVFQIRADSIVGIERSIEFESGSILGVTIYQDMLELTEPCCDGYSHKYAMK